MYQLRGFPPNAINVYLLGDVLIDAGTRHAERRIMRQLAGRPLSAHALTHAHPDHQGSSHAVCERLGIPLWCGGDDVNAMETPGGVAGAAPPSWQTLVQRRYWTGPRPRRALPRRGRRGRGLHPARDARPFARARRLLARVPPRARARDVLTNINVMTGARVLHEPLAAFTPDPARNRASARRLAALEPALVCFGHGPPLRNPGELARCVATLPA